VTKKKRIKGRLAPPPGKILLPEIPVEGRILRRWPFLVVLTGLAVIIVIVSMDKASEQQPEEVSIVEIQSPPLPVPQPPPPPPPPKPPEPQKPITDQDEKPPEAAPQTPSEPQFGLSDDATDDDGDMEVATGNTLMKAADSIVKPAPPSLPAVNTEAVLQEYKAGLVRFVVEHQQYPRIARRQNQQGVVRVRFSIERDGRIADVLISGASQFDLLNQGAKQTLEQLAFYKPLPICLDLSRLVVEIPIKFTLE
jgi:protein TonB